MLAEICGCLTRVEVKGEGCNFHSGESSTEDKVPDSESKLFDGDALGQIPRLIHVAASPYRYVVGEELEWDHFEQG